ncbi:MULTISPECIES: hypothetical protein [unclassified Streptomyces]|uniref:hypothetical protein n=1 Tax=unclassified Streptomyces TaxID=2593676 RepID=UPI00130195C9|nr:hypothetical protein [Streptomyces sp. TSRI0281]
MQQWSDGTVTVERMKTDSVGITASVSAGIPGLRDWGGNRPWKPWTNCTRTTPIA